MNGDEDLEKIASSGNHSTGNSQGCKGKLLGQLTSNRAVLGSFQPFQIDTEKEMEQSCLAEMEVRAAIDRGEVMHNGDSRAEGH